MTIQCAKPLEDEEEMEMVRGKPAGDDDLCCAENKKSGCTVRTVQPAVRCNLPSHLCYFRIPEVPQKSPTMKPTPTLTRCGRRERALVLSICKQAVEGNNHGDSPSKTNPDSNSIFFFLSYQKQEAPGTNGAVEVSKPLSLPEVTIF
ncbi:unnamed protein product [Cuscuta epithymum]|uniref:Uncharacterized protein n=1 Tax=Cuscuta epithymum TaxID=186058 RepID=A0AAV0FUI8_9ASTE|nr:unnamed protein product [Cuscuta epithymum]